MFMIYFESNQDRTERHYADHIFIQIIVKKLNSLKHLVRTTVAELNN